MASLSPGKTILHSYRPVLLEVFLGQRVAMPEQQKWVVKLLAMITRFFIA
jgi:hypothetical protein